MFLLACSAQFVRRQFWATSVNFCRNRPELSADKCTEHASKKTRPSLHSPDFLLLEKVAIQLAAMSVNRYFPNRGLRLLAEMR